MTKDQFLSGQSFRVKGIYTDKGSATYYYKEGILNKQIRSVKDERVLTDDYHLNISQISDEGFTGFVFVMDKHVEVNYWFEDLEIFEEIKEFEGIN